MSESIGTAGAARFSLGDAIILGLSSSGPAQTLSVSIAAMVAACHYGGVVPVLLCFVPMLGIAIGYQRLNRWNPNSGATYTWVAQVFHPLMGFLAGWMILLYYTLGTSSLTIPAGTYTLELLAPGLVSNPMAVAVAGAFWNILVTWVAIRGLKVAARFEWAIVIFQYVVLLIVAMMGFVALRQSGQFSWHWFSLSAMGGLPGLLQGTLIACFMYSGWDASIYVNEESADQSVNPGRAAIASVVILALFYSVTIVGLQSVLSPVDLQRHAGNALALIATRLLSGPWGVVMSLVVLTGTLATLQAAVISAARVGFAMSRDRVMPALFRIVDPKTGNPWAATLVMSTLNLILLTLALATSDVAQALNNVVGSLGMISALFYGLTGAAAVWQNRALLRRSSSDFIGGGVMPGLGALFMAWIIIESIRSGAISPAIVRYGLGSVALGLLVALAVRTFGNTPFFRSRGSHDDRSLNLE